MDGEDRGPFSWRQGAASEPEGQGPHRPTARRDWKVGEVSAASWQRGACPLLSAWQGGCQLWTGGGKGHCWKARGRNRQRGGAGPAPTAALPQAGHPPLRAEAAAEEEESHARELQHPPARGLEHLPVDGNPIRAASFPEPRAQPQGGAEGGLGCFSCPPTRPSGHSHEPVQPPNHQLLPSQQSLCQPQGLVASTQDALKHTAGQGDVLHPDPCRTLLPASRRPLPHLSCAVICLQIHFGDKLGNVQSGCG